MTLFRLQFLFYETFWRTSDKYRLYAFLNLNENFHNRMQAPYLFQFSRFSLFEPDAADPTLISQSCYIQFFGPYYSFINLDFDEYFVRIRIIS